MPHLSPAELIDLAEGTRSPVPHLSGCEVCRRHVAELRVALRAAAAAEVPEPSPLFWDHLSARVREAVQAEPPFRRWWDVRALRPRTVWTVAASAVVAIAAVATLRAPRQPAERAAPPPSITAGARARSADDPSLAFVADLTAGFDWDQAAAAGLAPRLGAADKAIAELTDAERRELERLIKNEMSHPGA